MIALFIPLLILAALFMVLLVLVQKSKKSSGMSPLESSTASNLIGISRTTDLIERLTWGTALFIAVLALSMGWYVKKKKQQQLSYNSPNIERAQANQLPVLPAAPEKAPTKKAPAPTSSPATTKKQPAAK